MSLQGQLEAGSENIFQIGLTMSGAVSAGAYTAGVFDFLIQALDEWEAARGQPGVPPHRVGLKVMSGASAGAITAAVGTVALACENVPKKFASPDSGQEYEYIFDRLYHTWVEGPALVKPDRKDLLARRDLDAQEKAEPKGRVSSVLDVTVLDDIMRDALSNTKPAPPRPYVSASLDVYKTLSNMRGTPYNIPFHGGSYGMMAHSDRVHYRITGIGTWQTHSNFAAQDAGKALKAADLVGPSGASAEWTVFGQAAVASGAFPIGLAARTTAAVRGDYNRLFPQPSYYQKMRLISASFPPLAANQADSVAFTTIDGGVIDNDPFEYARFTLMDTPPLANESAPEKADRAVIMIAPFPEPPSFPKEGVPPTDLVSIILKLLPALKDQARFKPAELVAAGSEDHASRYLIGPRRVPPEGKPENPAPDDDNRELFGIACGALGGFGGFLARSFRDHDFQLGRRNCQQFLMDSFALPPENPVFSPAWIAAYGNREEYLTRTPAQDGKRWVPIIPLLGSAAKPVPYFAWPRLKLKDFELLQNRIQGRITSIGFALLGQNLKGIVLWAASFFTAWLAKGHLAEASKYFILADLVRRDQIEGWELPAEWHDKPKVRIVLAAFLSPLKKFHDIPGLVVDTGLRNEELEPILNKCKQATGRPYEIWEAPWRHKRTGERIFALASRKPNLFDQAKYQVLGFDEAV